MLNQLPREVKFCCKCVISNQRPRIVFDDSGFVVPVGLPNIKKLLTRKIGKENLKFY